MHQISAVHIALSALLTVAGCALGWFLRGKRAQEEKAGLNASWQDQIHAQRVEHDRLVQQNKGLMDQVSQFQTSSSEAQAESRELAGSLDDATARHDELQQEIRAVRGELESTLGEKQRLQSDVNASEAHRQAASAKDSEIAKLRAELQNWQDRVPPLIRNFRQRNEDATRLAAELDSAQARIEELEEALTEREETRVEPVHHPAELTNGLGVSNDPGESDSTSESEIVAESEPVVEADSGVAEIPSNDDAVADDEPDDAKTARDNLQAIKGIGPAIEKTLNEMGIVNFSQIAQMGEYEIDRIARRLPGFHSRIYREDWIGQARELRDHSQGD